MIKYLILLVAVFQQFHQGFSYSALEDERILRAFIGEKDDRPTNHAKVARELVHKANWGSAGTISTNSDVLGYPMVNIISIADSAIGAESTGIIYFLLTTLDFTGQDIEKNNKLTFMISDDENLECSKSNTDPMEPTCARVMVSGKVLEMKENMTDYNFGMSSFISRHPAAVKWMNEHTFMLCKLDIKNIFVLDWYGGPHNVKAEDYYNVKLDESEPATKSKWSKIITDLNDIEGQTSKDDLTLKIPKHKYRRINLKF